MIYNAVEEWRTFQLHLLQCHSDYLLTWLAEGHTVSYRSVSYCTVTSSHLCSFLVPVACNVRIILSHLTPYTVYAQHPENIYIRIISRPSIPKDSISSYLSMEASVSIPRMFFTSSADIILVRTLQLTQSPKYENNSFQLEVKYSN